MMNSTTTTTKLFHTQTYLNSIFNQSHSLHSQQQQHQSNQLQSDSSSDSSHSTTTTTTTTTTTVSSSSSSDSSSSPVSDSIQTQPHPISHIIDLLDQPNEDEKPEMLKSYLLNHHSNLIDVLNSELDSIVLSILHLHRQDTINSNSNSTNSIIKNTITSKLKPHSNLIRSNSTNNNSNNNTHYNSRRTCPSPRPLNRTQSYHLQTSSLSSSPTQFNSTINTPDKLSATASEFKPNKSVSSHPSITNLRSSIPSNANANATLWSFSPSPIGTPKFQPAPTSYLHTLEDTLNVQSNNPTITHSTTTTTTQTSYFNQLHIPSAPWNSSTDQAVDFIPRDPWNTTEQQIEHIPRDPWNTSEQHIPRDPWNTSDHYSDQIPRDPWIHSTTDHQALEHLPRDTWNYLVSEEPVHPYDQFSTPSPPLSEQNSIRSNPEECYTKSQSSIDSVSNLSKHKKPKTKNNPQDSKFKIPLISIENVKDETQTKFKSSTSNTTTSNKPVSPSKFSTKSGAQTSDLDCSGTQPPLKVCRFYLQGSCLRSDCKFSHDLSKAICRFWLRGHCLKGEVKCDFLHEIPDLGRSNTPTININLAKSKQTKKKHKGVVEPEEVKETSNETFEDAFPSLMESMTSLNQTKPTASKPLTPSSLLPKEYLELEYDEVVDRSVSKERRDECVERYKVCLKLNDEVGKQSWLEEIQTWNEKIQHESNHQKEQQIASRNRKLKDILIQRVSQNTSDRMKKGKEIGHGICLGVKNEVPGTSLNAKQRMEVFLDLNGFSAIDLKESIIKFVAGLRVEGFCGLAYVLVSEVGKDERVELEKWLDENSFKSKIFDEKMICIDPVIQ